MTRWLNETCPTCGDKKEMYNKPVCFKCEKPEVKQISVIDFGAACRRVEVKYGFNEHPLEGPNRKLWELLTEYGWNHNNEAWCWIPLVGMIDEPGAWGPDFGTQAYSDQYEEVIKFIEALIEEFDLRNQEIYWHISY